jgi:hypothetical protein
MSEIEEQLYRALVAAVDHLEGEVRLIALAAIAKAEGRDCAPHHLNTWSEHQ